MKIVEVAVVTLVILIVLIFAVLAVENIFSNVAKRAMFKQTVYPYGMFKFLELQGQGKAELPLTKEEIPTMYSLGVRVPKSYGYFGITFSDGVSDIPDESHYTLVPDPTPIDWVYSVGTFYRFFMMKEIPIVYGNGSLFLTESNNAYLVTVFPLVYEKTYSNFETQYSSTIPFAGAFYITSSKTSNKKINGHDVMYPVPKCKNCPPVFSDAGFGGYTQFVLGLWRDPYPFNSLSAKEQFYITPGQATNIVVTSQLSFYGVIDKYLLSNGALGEPDVVGIGGDDYSILAGARSVYLMNYTLSGSYTIDVYFGRLVIREDKNSPQNFQQVVTIVALPPAIYPEYVNPSLITIEYKPISIKVKHHKKWLIFTVSEGDHYTMLSYTYKLKSG